jgi:hypothetical protein
LIDLAKIEKKYSARDVKICYDEVGAQAEFKSVRRLTPEAGACSGMCKRSSGLSWGLL